METLTSFVRTHGLVFAAIAGPNGELVAAAGDAALLEHQGLVKTLTRDEGARSRLISSLSGQLLPQTWRQGSVVAYATILDGQRLAIAFEHSKLDAVSGYHRAKQLDAALRSLFA